LWGAQLWLGNRAAPGDQVDDEDYDRNHQQDVDESACDVQAEA
jgi:hypothetical protein